MAWVNVQGDTIVARNRKRPEKVWVQDHPEYGHFEPIETDAEAISFGWFPLVVEDQPDDTETTTWDEQIFFEAAQVRMSWVERAKTQAELDADAEQAVKTSEQDQARQAVQNLQAFITDNNPSNAEVVAACKLMARVCVRLIKDNYGD